MTKLNRPIEEIYPLSPLQSGLLYHSLNEPQSDAYFHHAACELHGDLDVEAWKRSWQQIIDRHPILRTAFIWEQRDEPFQVVYRQVQLPWEQQDWRGLDSDEQQARFADYLRAESRRGLKLSKAPLMRCALFSCAGNVHRFVWSFHHLLVDGWSVAILLKEVMAFYESFRQGLELHLPEPRPYRDYIKWLRQQEQSTAESFWREKLKGFAAPTPLVVDRGRTRPSHDEARFGFRQLFLPESLTGRLAALAREQQITLFTIVQGAWALLLSRYSGERDIVFGSTFSGRPPALSGAGAMVGPFINTLPVRVRLASDTSLLPWLRELQESHLAMLEHQHTSLSDVQRWSDVPAGHGLFESILVFQNFPMRDSWQEHARSIEIQNISTIETAHYPLGLRVTPGAELLLELGYERARFEEPMVRRLLGHLQTMLEGIAEHPRQRISTLSLLTESEREQLSRWNLTDAGYLADSCIHELFEAQAARTPEAIAVIFEQQQLTYSSLDGRANQLARHLRSIGVGPEMLVGLCVETSVEMIVGILGILKAGGAYVPLDPLYPKERLAFMFEDARITVLLTQERLLDDLPAHGGWTLCLDAERRLFDRESAEPIAGDVAPNNPAYLLYTSGSTGKPKGVLIEHRGVSNLALMQRTRFEVEPGQRILQFSSLSFDASVWEIFMALVAGATLCLARREHLLPGPDLTRVLREQAITHVTLPPTVLALLPEENFPALKTIIVAGEVCPPNLVERWADVCRFFNAYGPSETTVCATMHECRHDDVRAPIGRPIFNVQVYLLDADLQPVPVGVPGEVHVAGVGLARGYYNRPQLTAESFIPHHFSTEPGARMYKTGDLAYYREDGSIEFLNRLDDQIKLHGLRIELGEIQTILSHHPAIRSSYVMLREDVPGDKRLVAYIVFNPELSVLPKDRQQAIVHQLKAFIREHLPGYMVPSTFVILSSLPLTPQGKVNRRALCCQEETGHELEGSYVAPRSRVEATLAEIWCQVLNVGRVGIHDNFFDLGGDSILSVHVAARAVQSGIMLTPGHFIQHPTIALLAALAEIADGVNEHADRGVAAPIYQTVSVTPHITSPGAEPDVSVSPGVAPDAYISPLVPLRTHGAHPPLFCVHTGTGSVLPYRYLIRHLGSERAIYGLQFPDLSRQQPSSDIRLETVAALYVKAIREIQPEGPYLLAGHSGGSLFAFEMSRQLQEQGQKIALLAVLDNPAPSECREHAKGGSVVVMMVNLLKRFFREQALLSEADLSHLVEDEQLQYLLERLKGYDFAPLDADLEWVRGYMQVQENIVDAIQRYAWAEEAGSRTVHSIPITLLRTREFSSRYGDSAFGWNDYTNAGIKVHEVPGDHVTMLAEPYVQNVAAILKECLDTWNGSVAKIDSQL